MSENTNVVEQHGCIVCAKIHTLLVVYAPDGHMVDCTVTSPGGRRVPDERRPLVACERHTQAEIEKALAHHYPGQPADDSEEDE
ncbi:MAG: hypothetical protein WCE68_11080 [Anaerolineales bacterium]